MVTWAEFVRLEPDLATAGRDHLYRFGVGLAFLATIRPDGGPRLHPMCPVIDDDGLYAFLIPSPKRDDLRRDPRYAMHCYPPDDNEDAFYLTGHAAPVEERAVLDRLATQFLQERGWTTPPEGFDEQALFVFDVRTCLLTVTTGHGDPHPLHTVWRAPH
jgi:pyridoxamine 5'-phosphate oxidase-like protein